MHSLDFRIVIIKKGVIVEAMSSKVILIIPKNQELSKGSSKDSRIKFQDSRFKIQEESRSRFKAQDSRIKRRLNQNKY